MKFRYLVLCIVMIFFFAAGVKAHESFVFEDLGGFGGHSGTAEKVVLTKDGPLVVGESFELPGKGYTAFLWTTKTGLNRLPYLNKSYPGCAAADVNSSRVAVGFCFDVYPNVHAVRWESDGRLTDLTPDCPWDCEAYAVNKIGQAVGFWTHPESRLHEATLWDKDGMTFLGTLGQHSYAYDISDGGRIVGESQLKRGGIPRAVLFTGHRPRVLGTLGGYSSGAIAINEQGFITGVADLRSGPGRAFLGDSLRHNLQPLPAPETVDWAIGLDINEANQIVGQFTDPSGGNAYYAAFFWQPGMPEIVDLNNLVRLPDGWVLFDARGVSEPAENGGLPYIVGTVLLPDGTSWPYLLRPTR